MFYFVDLYALFDVYDFLDVYDCLYVYAGLDVYAGLYVYVGLDVYAGLYVYVGLDVYGLYSLSLIGEVVFLSFALVVGARVLFYNRFLRLHLLSYLTYFLLQLGAPSLPGCHVFSSVLNLNRNKTHRYIVN